MDNCIYHYTSVYALTGILRKEGVVLFATRYNHLNDPWEYRWALDYIMPNLKKIAEQNEAKYDEVFHAYPYTISLCEFDDYLNMWRLYSKDGLGYSIGLDSAKMSGYGKEPGKWPDVLQSITYANKRDLEQKIISTKAVYDKDYASGDIVADLHEICALIKSDDYEIENEFRYLRILHDCFEADSKDNISEGEEHDAVKFRCRENEQIPYIEICFPKRCIKKYHYWPQIRLSKRKRNDYAVVKQFGL